MMNLLTVGASHRTADLTMLERLAVPDSGVPDTLAQALGRDHITEAVVLSTCNRVEVYAGVTGFHGGLADVSAVLAERVGLTPAELAPYLYVRWDADAVTHALRVAAGLDSMVVGETQVLGQLRAAYTAASEADAAGRLLHQLMQQTLRVGKRAHAETGIGAAARSVVTAALELAAGHLAGAPEPGDEVLRERGALVIGAGAMGALAVTTLARSGAAPLYLANRDPARAQRLADSYGARPVRLDRLAEVLPRVDLVVSATASPGQLLPATTVGTALTGRSGERPLVICDLAVPRDVEPATADLPGVALVDTDRLAAGVSTVAGEAVAAAEEIIVAEAEELCATLRDTRVAPTVAALRTRADEIVAAELDRLAQRRPDLTDEQRAEVAHTVHRLVQQLLHQPTVRVRQLAARPDGESYAAALAELFDLRVPQPQRVDQVPPVDADGAPVAPAGGLPSGDQASSSGGAT